jgi:lipase chaperone LimK
MDGTLAAIELDSIQQYISKQKLQLLNKATCAADNLMRYHMASVYQLVLMMKEDGGRKLNGLEVCKCEESCLSLRASQQAKMSNNYHIANNLLSDKYFDRCPSCMTTNRVKHGCYSK